MAVTAVMFDVDETPNREAVADACGVPRFTLTALVGVAIERGESHPKVHEWLDIDPPRPYVDFVSSSERLGVEKPPAAIRIDSLDELPGALT